MREFLNKIFFLLLILITLPVFSIACRLYYEPKSKFEPELYIFIGEVIGYTEGFNSKETLNKSYGLKVKVLENVHLPRESNDFYEVFPFDISSDCAKTIGLSETSLQKFYPINSKLTVIAEFWKLSQKNKTGRVMLSVENVFNNYKLLSHDSKELRSTAASVFDFTDQENNYRIFEFELLKDLKRLEESSSDEEKVKIFERLIYLPKKWIDFEAAVENHIKDPETRLILINRRKDLK
jgi:hypothetical protein